MLPSIRSLLSGVDLGSSASPPPAQLAAGYASSPRRAPDAAAHAGAGGQPPWCSNRTFDGLPVKALLNNFDALAPAGSLSPANCEDLAWFASPPAPRQRVECLEGVPAGAALRFEGDEFLYFAKSLGLLPLRHARVILRTRDSDLRMLHACGACCRIHQAPDRLLT
jgi:hypothetical protein